MLEHHQEGSSDIEAAAKAILFLQQHQEHGEDEETEPNAKGWMLPNGPLPCFAPLVAKTADSEQRKTKTKTTKSIIIGSAAKSSSTTETGKGDNDDDFAEATISTTTTTTTTTIDNLVSLSKTSMSVPKKSRSPKCGKKRYRSPKHHHLSAVHQAGPPKKSKTLSLGGSTNHRNKHEPHQQPNHPSNFVDLSLTDDERTVETSNLSSNIDRKVGMRNNPLTEMKFIDAMGQKLTGQAQETFQAIVASAREGYARILPEEKSPVLYEKLPHAIWTNVRLLIEPKQYLRASAAVREEWNNGTKKTTATRSNPNVPQAIELLMKQQQSNNKSQLENSQPSTTIKTNQLNCTTKTQGGAIRMGEAASKLTKSSLRRNLPRTCANRPLQTTNPSTQSALDQTSQDNLPPNAANSKVQPTPSIDLTTKSCSATTTTTNSKIKHGKKSAMQLALRFGFAMRLRQYKEEQQLSQRNHHHPSRLVNQQPNVQELMEMAERKLIDMTPVERDDLWNDIEELMEQVENAV